MENRLDIELCKDIFSFGIKPTERVLHLGCGDKQTNLLDNIQTINPAIFYLGVDIDPNVIENFKEKYKDFPTYAFENTTIQNFLDFNMRGREGNLEFDNTVITGIFDKPIYKEQQHIFISTVVRHCLQYCNSVIFTINENNFKDYNYSILYVINNLISSFDNFEIKKKKNQYIFCVKN